MKKFAIIVFATLLLQAEALAQHPKTVVPEVARALLLGEGMGLAKPAELNGFPGPRHVLELADSLHLSSDQTEGVQVVFDRMHEDAVALGHDVLELESDLDSLFAAGKVTEDEFRSRLGRIAELNARLRAVHLKAHLTTRELLSSHQVARYDELRGHTRSETGHEGHH